MFIFQYKIRRMKKLFVNSDIDSYSKIFTLLGYKEETRKKTFFKNISLVTYKKEKEVKDFKSLKDRYAPRSTVPFFFVILCAIIAVGFATAFLVINIVNKDIDKLYYFYLLMLPTFFFTLLATGLSFYRYINELKNVEKVAATRLLEKEVQ